MATHKATDFDDLVCLRILQFTNPSSWSINQPFLISKTFNNVFSSDGFTRDFLMRKLQLDQVDDLQKAITLMKDAVLAEKTKKKKEKKLKKKRKKDESDDEEEDSVKLPMNLRDVLKIYVKCNGKGDDVVVKEKVVSLMENFNKSRKVSLLSSAIDRISFLKSGIEIQDGYKKLEGEIDHCINFFVGSTTYDIPSTLFPSLYRNLKGVYVLRTCDEDCGEEKVYETSVIVFLNCGYPLFIETKYQDEVDSYRSNNTYNEDVSVYGKNVFSHSKRSNQHGYFDTEFTHSISRDIFNIIQSLVFKPDLSKVLSEEELFSKHPPQAIKEGLMYEFFQLAFGKNAYQFMSDCEEWVPFRQMDDDFDEEDDEQVAEGDEFIDDEDVDGEEEEKANKALQSMGYKRKRSEEEEEEEEEEDE